MKVKFEDFILDDTDTYNKFDTCLKLHRSCTSDLGCKKCCYYNLSLPKTFSNETIDHCLIRLLRKYNSDKNLFPPLSSSDDGEIAKYILKNILLKATIFIQEEMEI